MSDKSNWWDDTESKPVDLFSGNTPRTMPASTPNTKKWWESSEDKDVDLFSKSSSEAPKSNFAYNYANAAKPMLEGPKEKTWSDFAKYMGSESAKGAINTLATPFRLGWDSSKRPEQPNFEDNISGSIVRGVPVARNIVPVTDQDKQYMMEHPNYETAGNIAGTVGTGLATGGLGVGSGALGYMGTQGLVNAGIGIADRESAGKSPSDVRNGAILDFLGGAGSAGIGRLGGSQALDKITDLFTPRAFDTISKYIPLGEYKTKILGALADKIGTTPVQAGINSAVQSGERYITDNLTPGDKEKLRILRAQGGS